jgi:hypothetical protein
MTDPVLVEIVEPGEPLIVEAIAAPIVIEVELGIPGPPGRQGIQGIQGIPGTPGLSGASYTHAQAVPAADWNITHNLARYPSVTVVDSAGTTVIGDIDYLSNNAIAIHFAAAFGGNAYLN